jgi:hypothetical protein
VYAVEHPPADKPHVGGENVPAALVHVIVPPGVIAVPVLASATVAVQLVATPTSVGTGAQATPVVSDRFAAVTMAVVALGECVESPPYVAVSV